VIHGRILAIALGFALLAGCSSAGTSVPAGSQATQASQQHALAPSGSSAAQHILAHFDTTSSVRRAQSVGGGSYDDGGWSELSLPVLQSCGNGSFSNDCANWAWAPGSRVSGSLGGPPSLNFCATTFPASLGSPALPIQALNTPDTFGISYVGTQPLPIVSLGTRSYVASITGSFGNTASATFTVTPLLTTLAGRGWLVFFTWSWPADVFVLPYQVNEIQLAASSSPLGLSTGGTASLEAADCLGDSIDALALGLGFSFSPPPTHGFAFPDITASSKGPAMDQTVYATAANPQGSILLYDFGFATALTTVGPPTASASPSPSPAPTPSPTPVPR
jgi:hypothetical protein